MGPKIDLKIDPEKNWKSRDFLAKQKKQSKKTLEIQAGIR